MATQQHHITTSNLISLCAAFMLVTFAACGGAEPETLVIPDNNQTNNQQTTNNQTKNNTQTQNNQQTTNNQTTNNTSPSAPNIIDLSTNTVKVSPETGVTITAIVTDPDGIDDLIGGSLKSPEGQTYGAFITSSSEGSYQIDLSWQDIGNVKEIVFTDTAGVKRTFVAEFFDQKGNKTSKQVELTVVCNTNDELACEPNTCINTKTNRDHCGQCNTKLPEGDTLVSCEDGAPKCRRDYMSWCSMQQSCSHEDNPVACGDCNTNCVERAQNAFPNITLAIVGEHNDTDSYVDCDDKKCEVDLYMTDGTKSCDEHCGSWKCTSSQGSFVGTGISASCSTRYKTAYPEETFEYVSCSCGE